MADRRFKRGLWPLQVLTYIALIFGLWGRIKGLGSAPLTSDEYYLVKSVDNILRTGVPAYPCGGLYMRGLTLQYPIALLRMLGVTPELAPRLLSLAGSLASLPAVFRLGNRLSGRWLGLLGVAWLAVSIWEIEMARFGRMYAPFQALFLWYLLALLEFVRVRSRAALLQMYALTIAGVFTWEGGIFMAVLNLLPVVVPTSAGTAPVRRDVHLASALALLAATFGYMGISFRPTSVPADFDYSVTVWSESPWPISTLSFDHARSSIVSVVLLGIAALMMLRAVPWLLTFRDRPWLLAALLAGVVAAAVHQYLLVACLLAAPVLLGYGRWPTLWRGGGWYWSALALSLAGWLAAGISDVDWSALPAKEALREFVSLGYAMAGFPDIARRVVLELLRAMPLLTSVCSALLLVAIAQAGSHHERDWTPRHLLLLVWAASVLMIALNAPGNQTRYAFFLYPLSVLLGLLALERLLSRQLPDEPRRVAVVTVLAVLTFIASEDFRPRHLARVDTPRYTFRQPYNVFFTGHLIWRTDMRTIAALLEHGVRPGDVVLSGLPGLEYYYAAFDYAYMNETEPRFPEWSCDSGRVDRWTNKPLVHSVTALADIVRHHGTTWLVLQDGGMSRLLQQSSWPTHVVFRGQSVTVAKVTAADLARASGGSD